MTPSIDIVVTWVDESDPEWINEKNKYSDSPGDKRDNRFRDWDCLKFWFRGIEKYAPWVRKVHLITCGHLPAWLNTEAEGLNIVFHKDYIDEKYLPTFSSRTIELNFGNINELSEKFICFNDDMYIINPTLESDFFKNDLPLDMAVLYPGYATSNDVEFEHTLLNDAQFFAKHFDIKEILKRDRKKFFNLLYGKNLIKTLTMKLYPSFTGFILHHQPQSFLKSTFSEVWKAEPELLDSACKSKFRNGSDINLYALRYWQLGKGSYEPANFFKRGDYVSINDSPLDYNRIISGSNKKILCLNDCSQSIDFEKEKANMISAFSKKFPDKSHFEL